MSGRRNAILDAAARVINARGFSHTSVEDLIEATGLSGKSHFYHYFPSKEALGIAVIDRQFERFTERGLALFIDTLVALQRERDGGTGSPFGNLAGEMADSHEGFRRRLDDVFARWTDQLVALLREAAPTLRDGVDSVKLARFIIAALEGGMLMTRVTRDIGVMEGIGEDLKRFIATHLRDGEARGLERATAE